MKIQKNPVQSTSKYNRSISFKSNSQTLNIKKQGNLLKQSLNSNKNTNANTSLIQQSNTPKKLKIKNQSTNSIHFQSNLSNLQQKQIKPLMQRLDNEFVKILQQLQTYYTQLNKHQQIRVEKWIVKIIQNDQTLRWKLNRNNYLKLLNYTVKTWKSLQQPFDKMPDLNKDLTYLSQHDLNQKIKPKFDGKSPSFHNHKPQMIKIDQPIGDSCSVLMSLINTARTNLSKQNHIQSINQQNQTFKQSKLLIQDQNYFLKNTRNFNKKQYKSLQKQNKIKVQKQNIELINNLIKKKEKNQYENQEDYNIDQQNHHQYQFSDSYKNNNQNDINFSSVIPSNLPSQVKSTTPLNPKNQFYSENRDGASISKYNNHQKYQKNSVQNSIISNNFPYSNLYNKNNLSQISQINIYKQLVLLMGKLLLKHQFTIQKQSQYWKLMRMIYQYQSHQNKINNNLISCPQSIGVTDRNDVGINYQSDRVDYNSRNKIIGNKKNQDIKKQQKRQSFEEFLSRLRVQIQQFNTQEQKKQNNQNNSHKFTQVFKTGAKFSQNTQNIRQNSNNFSNQQQFDHSNSVNNCKRKLYQLQQDIQQTFYHITQQSTDFKVQQGVIYFQLNDTQRRNENMTFIQQGCQQIAPDAKIIKNNHLRHSSNYYDKHNSQNKNKITYIRQKYNQQIVQDNNQNIKEYQQNNQQIYNQQYSQQYSGQQNQINSYSSDINIQISQKQQYLQKIRLLKFIISIINSPMHKNNSKILYLVILRHQKIDLLKFQNLKNLKINLYILFMIIYLN